MKFLCPSWKECNSRLNRARIGPLVQTCGSSDARIQGFGGSSYGITLLKQTPKCTFRDNWDMIQVDLVSPGSSHLCKSQYEIYTHTHGLNELIQIKYSEQFLSHSKNVFGIVCKTEET